MRPAWSVILFSTLSGAGYGLLGWIGVVELVSPRPANSLAALITGAALVTLGLVSSTFHLGHPERAWRALSQWRSSWLSREGLTALLTYLPVAWLGWAQWRGEPANAAAALTLAGSLVTVFCTAMIYASLRTVAAWHRPLVPLIYLLLAAASGGFLWLAVTGTTDPLTVSPVGGLLVLAALLKGGFWIVRPAPQSSVSSATGLTGQVRPLDPPHTADNYLLKEMVFQVGRRHARKLRLLALLLGLFLPLALLVLSLMAPQSIGRWLTVASLAPLLAGLLIERWLFFAEARHVVGLYYRAGAGDARNPA